MSIDVGIIESLNEFIEVEEICIKHEKNYKEHKVLKKSQGLHATKDEHKNRAMRECAFKA
jgi:cytochrome c-type biogenesis protein CcmE